MMSISHIVDTNAQVVGTFYFLPGKTNASITIKKITHQLELPLKEGVRFEPARLIAQILFANEFGHSVFYNLDKAEKYIFIDDEQTLGDQIPGEFFCDRIQAAKERGFEFLLEYSSPYTGLQPDRIHIKKTPARPSEEHNPSVLIPISRL